MRGMYKPCWHLETCNCGEDATGSRTVASQNPTHFLNVNVKLNWSLESEMRVERRVCFYIKHIPATGSLEAIQSELQGIHLALPLPDDKRGCHRGIFALHDCKDVSAWQHGKNYFKMGDAMVLVIPDDRDTRLLRKGKQARILIRPLPQALQINELHKICSQFGDVIYVRRSGENPVSAMVQFRNKEDADKALSSLNDTDLSGTRITVQKVQPASDGQVSQAKATWGQYRNPLAKGTVVYDNPQAISEVLAAPKQIRDAPQVLMASLSASPRRVLTDEVLAAEHLLAERIRPVKFDNDVTFPVTHKRMSVAWKEDDKEADKKGIPAKTELMEFDGEINPWELPPDMSLVCTCKIHGKNFIEQPWFQCFTCHLTEHTGTCVPCAITCHKGHDLLFQTCSRFYCDCFDACPICRQRGEHDMETIPEEPNETYETIEFHPLILQDFMVSLLSAPTEQGAGSGDDIRTLVYSTNIRNVNPKYALSKNMSMNRDSGRAFGFLRRIDAFKLAVETNDVIIAADKARLIGWWTTTGECFAMELESSNDFVAITPSPYEPGCFAAVSYPFCLLARCDEDFSILKQHVLDEGVTPNSICFVKPRTLALLCGSCVQVIDLEMSQDPITVLRCPSGTISSMIYLPEMESLFMLAFNGKIYMHQISVLGQHNLEKPIQRELNPLSEFSYSPVSNFIVICSRNSVCFLRPQQLFDNSRISFISLRAEASFITALQSDPRVHVFSAGNMLEFLTLGSDSTTLFSLPFEGTPFAAFGRVVVGDHCRISVLEPNACFTRAFSRAGSFEVPVTFWVDTDKDEAPCEFFVMGRSVGALLMGRHIELSPSQTEKTITVQCKPSENVVIGFDCQIEIRGEGRPCVIFHGRRFELQGKRGLMLPLKPNEIADTEHRIRFQTNGCTIVLHRFRVHSFPRELLKLPDNWKDDDVEAEQVNWRSEDVHLFAYSDQVEGVWESRLVSLLDLVASGMRRCPASDSVFKTFVKAMYTRPELAEPVRRAVVLSRPVGDRAYSVWAEAIEEVVVNEKLSEDGWELLWTDLRKLPSEMRARLAQVAWKSGQMFPKVGGVVTAFECA